MAKAILDKKFLTVQEDSDGLFLEFPDDLLEAMDWKPGDVITWTELPSGIGYSVTKTKTLDG